MKSKRLVAFWEIYGESLRDETSEIKEFWEQLFNGNSYGKEIFGTLESENG